MIRGYKKESKFKEGDIVEYKGVVTPGETYLVTKVMEGGVEIVSTKKSTQKPKLEKDAALVKSKKFKKEDVAMVALKDAGRNLKRWLAKSKDNAHLKKMTGKELSKIFGKEYPKDLKDLEEEYEEQKLYDMFTKYRDEVLGLVGGSKVESNRYKKEEFRNFDTVVDHYFNGDCEAAFEDLATFAVKKGFWNLYKQAKDEGESFIK